VTDTKDNKAFTHIFQQHSNIPPDKEDMQNRSSLDVFVQHYYKTTELKGDFEYVSEFETK
jgi:hypothetical protein